MCECWGNVSKGGLTATMGGKSIYREEIMIGNDVPPRAWSSTHIINGTWLFRNKAFVNMSRRGLQRVLSSFNIYTIPMKAQQLLQRAEKQALLFQFCKSYNLKDYLLFSLHLVGSTSLPSKQKPQFTVPWEWRENYWLPTLTHFQNYRRRKHGERETAHFGYLLYQYFLHSA